MLETCGLIAEPDLVLTVAPPVPRRVLGRPPVAAPRQTPAFHASPPPSSPPRHTASAAPVPAAAEPVNVAGSAVVSGNEFDETGPARWCDQRAVASAVVSLVVHVVVLMTLALIVTRPDAERRPRPLEIMSADTEAPFELANLDEEPVVEVLQPVVEEPAEELVEPVPAVVELDIENTFADVTPVAPALGGEELAGITAMDGGDFVARVGSGTAREPSNGEGGAGVTGFGGEVGRRLANAGARTGDIQVSLAWNNLNDIDLHVITPRGEHISYAHRQSMCRGMLDIDMNAGWPMSREPVENVFWPANLGPYGDFEIYVHHFAMNDRIDATPFEVHVLVNGERKQFTGSVSSGDPPLLVTRFRRVPVAPPPAEAATPSGPSANHEFVE